MCVQEKSTYEHIDNKFSGKNSHKKEIINEWLLWIIVMEDNEQTDPKVNQRVMLLPLYTHGTIEKQGEVVNYLIFNKWES